MPGVDVTEETPPCTAKHLNHVCIAVRSVADSLGFYGAVFGLGDARIEDIPDQGVRAAIVSVGGSQLELIEPTDPSGAIARFIDRRGEGLHHICFEVEDLQGALDRLEAKGVELIDKSPREGLAGMIAFIHPRATGGALVELVDEATTGR